MATKRTKRLTRSDLAQLAPREMLDETNIRKIALIERCLPVKSVIDYGGMWEVDGLFSRVCRKGFGIERVTMIDKYESHNWGRNPDLRSGIDFRKGDFSDERFMATIDKGHDLAMAYDVVMHQINFRHTLGLMVSKVSKFFVISQAILPDKVMRFRNCTILLSGSEESSLIPFNEKWTRKMDYWKNFRDASVIAAEHWLWGMTPSSIESLMAGFGWKLIHEQYWRGWLPKSSKWKICGLIFRRTRNTSRGYCTRV